MKTAEYITSLAIALILAACAHHQTIEVSEYHITNRVVDGVADRMERYEAIGNGQVPAVAAAALWALANVEQ